MEAIAGAAGVTKPVVYACFPGKDELFRALLAREEERILGEIQSTFEGTDLGDPEATLIEGYTGFLRAVARSPDVYRLIFLGEGGATWRSPSASRPGARPRPRRSAALARQWVEQRAGDRLPDEIDRTARLVGNAIAGMAESAARLMLASPNSGRRRTSAARSAASAAAQAAV